MRIFKSPTFCIVIFLALLSSVIRAEDSNASVLSAKHPESGFYANRVGVQFGTPEIEAAILKHLGYAGVSQDWVTGPELTRRVEAFEQVGLKFLSVYIFAEDTPIQADQIRGLANRGAHIEMPVKELTPKTIQSVRQTATTAEKLGIRIAIYPHSNYAIETVEQAMDFAAKVDHPNVGIMFPLCQFLREKDVDSLERLVRKAAPQLIAVNISGGDIDSEDVNQAIQTLDKGSFPQDRLATALESIDFKGPIELQSWGVPGDKFSNLKNGMETFSKLYNSLPRSDATNDLEFEMR